MSNVTSEVFSGSGESPLHPANTERTQQTYEALGACTIIRLSKELTFNDIFTGIVAVDETSVIYDRQNKQLDTVEILSQIN